ncbi:MAG: domain S-box-containing protein [Flaviaesturariibacter sp.]|nr:domain S-box-containing protein [Flaviaesturariibacter sp.]
MSLPHHTDPSLAEHFKKEEWLKDLFDHAHDLIQIVHPDGTILYVNNAWSNLLGYREEEIIGKSLYSFIEETNKNAYIAYRNAILQNRETENNIIFSLIGKQGQRITVEGSVSVKQTPEGVPLYTRGIFRDITLKLKNESQLKSFHEELKEREQNLQRLLTYAPDAVVVIDKDSRIIFWNPKAETIFGWTAAEVMHQPLSGTIVPPQYREAHDMGMKRYLATGDAHVMDKTIEITALNKKGEEFYISLTISKTVQKGEVVFIAFIRDIRAQKANQLELERKTKELERSNDNLEEFAHAASHDLKEPIRKVQTFASRLKESLAPKMTATEKGYFERMEIAAKRMGLLVDDLLEYSHVSQGEDGLETIDLSQSLRTVLEDLEVAIEEKGAVVTIGELPQIKGHKRQIQQLFQNLLSNGLKYTRPEVVPQIHISGGLVRGEETGLSLTTEEGNRSFHFIKVQDNGIGFEQKDADRIFKMFQRLHGKAEYSGTGVGLSIVRKVVENHKGYITAESQPNEGARFTIFLPAEIV